MDKEIEKAVKTFEEAKMTYEEMSTVPIEGSLDERVKARTNLALWEVRMKRAAKELDAKMQEAINE